MDNAQEVDAVIDQAIRRKRLVGAVVIALKAGQIVYQRAAGLADREAGLAMGHDTLFRGSSLTKPIVTLAVLSMMEKGMLHLDEPVTTYLPYFRPRLPNGDTPIITLRHLLTHTAGLSYEYPDDIDITTGITNTNLGLEETLRRVAKQPLSFVPGTDWKYSVASDVLGAVVAAIFGATLDDAVRHHVTAPLKMRDTAFGVTDQSRLAVPYADSKCEPVRMNDPHIMPDSWGGSLIFSPGRVFNPNAYQSGGAGIVTSASDFAKFLGMLHYGGHPLLSESTVRTAIADQLGDHVKSKSAGRSFSFLGRLTTNPVRAGTVWSAGTISWGGAFGHIWAFDPVQQISVISLTNTALYGCEGEYPRDLFHALFVATL